MYKKTAALLITLTTSLQAWLQPDPGQFAIEGEVLWLSASIEDNYYAASSDIFNVPRGERFTTPFNYHPAYRLAADYTFCNGMNNLRLFGTYFSHSVNDSKQGNLENPIFITQLPNSIANLLNGLATTAMAKNKARYYSIDALFGQTLFPNAPFSLSIQGGLQYTNIHVDENYFYEFNPDDVTVISASINYDDKMWGIGPEIGVDFSYGLPCWGFFRGFSLVANARAALLVSRNQASLVTENNSDEFFNFDFQNEPNYRICGFTDIQFGLNYVKKCSCFSFSLEAGYEVMNYQKVLNKVRVINDFEFTSAGSYFDEYSDFGLHGPYLALGISF